MPTSPERRLTLPEFQRQQLAFTAHIRDPLHEPLPDGIPPRRMAVYTELLFNNIHEQLSANFPVLRTVIGGDRWHAMMRDFMIRHRCTTPLFTEIGQEFLEYLGNTRTAAPDDPPFVLELAHYEYVELAVSISDDDDTTGIDPDGDLLHGIPAVSAAAWNLSYRWPVHQIGPDCMPDTPPAEPTHLVVYRDHDDAVHFLQINAVTQRLLQLLQDDRGLTGIEVLQTIARELQHGDPQVLVPAGRGLLEDLRRRNVILGTRH